MNHIQFKSAFTLIELLLVLSIMAVLVVLSVSAISRLRANAKSIKCVSQLGQVGFALNSYANDNGNRFPTTYAAARTPPDLSTWMAKAAPYVGLLPSAIGNSPAPRSAGVFVCPSFSYEEWKAREVSYRYNSAIETVWGFRRIIMPLANLFLVVETEGENTENLTIKSGIDVARRHPSKSANFLYADGHVEAIGVRVPESDPRWGSSLNVQ